jgi:hypothetical protein
LPIYYPVDSKVWKEIVNKKNMVVILAWGQGSTSHISFKCNSRPRLSSVKAAIAKRVGGPCDDVNCGTSRFQCCDLHVDSKVFAADG